MMKFIQKEVKQEENLYILYNIIYILYERYRYTIPKKLEESLYKLLTDLEKEYTKDYEDLDIIQCDLVEKLIFEDTKKIK